VISRDTDIGAALRVRRQRLAGAHGVKQRGFLLNPFRFGATGDPDRSKRSLLMHMEGASFTDSSPNAFTITATGATQDTGWSYFGTKSALIATSSSSTNKITVPNNAVFDFGAEEYSIEFALRLATLPGTSGVQQCVILKAAATGVYPFQVVVNTSNQLVFRGFDLAGTANFSRVSTTTLAANTTYWVQCRRFNGVVSGTFGGGVDGAHMELAINGTQEAGGSAWSKTTAISQNTAAVVIGNYNSGAVQPVLGRIDELRLTKGRAEAFAVPTSAFPDA
jgi:hypothetical protein